jgi:hypothetical protein
MNERVESKNEKGEISVKYIPRYDFDSDEARMVSAACHVVYFIVVIIICLTLFYS